MLIPIVTSLLGAVAGAVTARRRKGVAADMALYAVVWAIIAGLLGFLALIVVSRV